MAASGRGGDVNFNPVQNNVFGKFNFYVTKIGSLMQRGSIFAVGEGGGELVGVVNFFGMVSLFEVLPMAGVPNLLKWSPAKQTNLPKISLLSP